MLSGRKESSTKPGGRSPTKKLQNRQPTRSFFLCQGCGTALSLEMSLASLIFWRRLYSRISMCSTCSTCFGLASEIVRSYGNGKLLRAIPTILRRSWESPDNCRATTEDTQTISVPRRYYMPCMSHTNRTPLNCRINNSSRNYHDTMPSILLKSTLPGINCPCPLDSSTAPSGGLIGGMRIVGTFTSRHSKADCPETPSRA